MIITLESYGRGDQVISGLPRRELPGVSPRQCTFKCYVISEQSLFYHEGMIRWSKAQNSRFFIFYLKSFLTRKVLMRNKF